MFPTVMSQADHLGSCVLVNVGRTVTGEFLFDILLQDEGG